MAEGAVVLLLGLYGLTGKGMGFWRRRAWSPC